MFRRSAATLSVLAGVVALLLGPSVDAAIPGRYYPARPFGTPGDWVPKLGNNFSVSFTIDDPSW
jgi:hypothetical protein